MRDFNRDNRRDDRRGGGGRDFGRPSMHRATCAECGNDCEVPFRPSGDRPVYCSNCFEKRGNRDNSFRPSGGSSDRTYHDRPRNQDNGQMIDQLRSLNAKLDRIINILEPKKIEFQPQQKAPLLDLTDISPVIKTEKPKTRKVKAKKKKTEAEISL